MTDGTFYTLHLYHSLNRKSTVGVVVGERRRKWKEEDKGQGTDNRVNMYGKISYIRIRISIDS